MAVTGSDPGLRPDTGSAAGDTASPLRRLLSSPARLWHYFGIPLVVTGSLVWLYGYARGVEFTSREQRSVSRDFIIARGVEHITLGLLVVAGVLLIAIPLGMMLTRPWAKRVTPVFVSIANAGQAIPSIGLLVLLAIWQGIGARTAVIGVIAYCILPVLRNTMVGIQQVDAAIIEAGRGMGMTKRAVLWRIELPLAIPVMLAGVRTALILAVGTITLGALIGAGTFGRIIDAGVRGFSTPVLLIGGVLTAALALTIDWIAGIAEDVLRPRGL
ncbi:MAG TPA: ABC transporter permease [Egibacteraceae bacterium]|nr:ABC transporter permease [Egibacteraceae bacterium]